MSDYSTQVSKWIEEGPAPGDASEKRHHVQAQNGKLIKFRNPHPSSGSWQDITFFGTVRAALWARLQGKLIDPDVSGVKIPTVKSMFPPIRTGTRSFISTTPSLRTTWIGHSCCYVEFSSGLCILFDPVFEDRCGPSQLLGYKRFTAPACEPADLPAVDAVIISHSHYDHLSYKSIKDVASAHPNAHFFVGLGLAASFESMGIKRVTEMDWWENATLKMLKTNTAGEAEARHQEGSTQSITAQVTCLPSQHASGRSAWDKDHTLWASWAVSSGGKSVWFAGDTGYRAVPDYPKVRTFTAPTTRICQYVHTSSKLANCMGRLTWVLSLLALTNHDISSVHGMRIHTMPWIYRDTKCKAAIGIHWGAWAL
ncbi:beta-lactamase superfamily domain-containing protein, partial [Pestalotiopsis sp. NC0098]